MMTLRDNNTRPDKGTGWKRNGNKRGSVLQRILPRKGYAALFFLMAVVAIGFLAMLTVVSAFPAGVTMGLIICMFVLLITADVLFIRRSKSLRIAGIAVAALFLVVYGMGTYYLGTTYATFARLGSSDGDNANSVSRETGLDLTQDAFNIYITGIDMWESEKGRDLERSDVNMIVTVSPRIRKILLTSIPRDTYVMLHTAQEMDKLTHTGVYGVYETLNTVEDWLGVDLNYYVKMNFTAVVDIINAIGGVEVYSPKSFVPTKRSWWTVKKGWNHMNGKEALAFARERAAFNSEDSQRVENQQRVVDAVLKKMMTSPKLLTKYPKILRAASDNMETNMSSDDMQTLVRMQLEDLGEWDIEMQKITGEYDMDYVASLTQDQKFQVYRPSASSVREVLSRIDETMNPTEEQIQAMIEDKKKASFAEFMGRFRRGSSDGNEDED